MPSATDILGIATVLAIISLALVGLGFGTDCWVKIDVDEGQAPLPPAAAGYSALTMLDRDVGLFRTCFDDNPVLDNITNKLGPNCIRNHYEIPEKNNNVDDSNYEAYIHMMRTVIALLMLCLLMLLIGVVVGCLGCWRASATQVRGASMLVLLAALFGLAGMGVWMGAEYVEKEKVTVDTLHAVIPFPKTLTQELAEATSRSYGWSFYVAWVGAGLSLLAGILYLVAATSITEEKEERDSNMRYTRKQQAAPVEPMPVVYALDSSSYTRAPQAVVYQQPQAPPLQYYDTRLVRQM